MVFMANGGAVAEVAATAEIQIQHAALHTILHANPCACAVYSSALLHLLNFSCYSGCSTASSTTGSPSTALAALHHCRNPRATVPRRRPPAIWDDLVDDSARDVGSVVCALTPPPSVLIVEGKRFMHSSPVADLLKPVQPCLHAQAKQTIVAASATELAVQAQPDALVLPNAFPHKGPDLWVSLTCGSANFEPPKHLTTEYTLGKDSQEWCTAMVLSFICISNRAILGMKNTSFVRLCASPDDGAYRSHSD